AQESLHALRTVQAFGGYPTEEKKFDSKVQSVVDYNRKEALASAIFFGTTGWAGNVTVLMLLGYGGTLVSRGEISVGDLTSLLLYTAYVGSSLGSLSSFFSSVMKGIGAGTRVFGLLEREPVIPPRGGVEFLRPDPTTGEGVGTIRFDKVSFHYPSRPKVSVLKDFDMELRSGESVAIVGKSGSGKSSVHNLLLRFYDPNQGKITYNGRDIRELTVDSWRSVIGVVPQEPILFTGTIASNIAYGKPEATREEIEEAARQANCEFIWDLPNGFGTEVGRASLSGGQKQRIAIARALLPKPSILCLDEATSALDAASELQASKEGSKFRELMKAQYTAAATDPTALQRTAAEEGEGDDVEDEGSGTVLDDPRGESIKTDGLSVLGCFLLVVRASRADDAAEGASPQQQTNIQTFERSRARSANSSSSSLPPPPPSSRSPLRYSLAYTCFLMDPPVFDPDFFSLLDVGIDPLTSSLFPLDSGDYFPVAPNIPVGGLPSEVPPMWCLPPSMTLLQSQVDPTGEAIALTSSTSTLSCNALRWGAAVGCKGGDVTLASTFVPDVLLPTIPPSHDITINTGTTNWFTDFLTSDSYISPTSSTCPTLSPTSSFGSLTPSTSDGSTFEEYRSDTISELPVVLDERPKLFPPSFVDVPVAHSDNPSPAKEETPELHKPARLASPRVMKARAQKLSRSSPLLAIPGTASWQYDVHPALQGPPSKTATYKQTLDKIAQFCRCKTQTEKPHRHWAACPFNPERKKGQHVCEICGVAVSRKDNLKRHMKDKH
ncbi:ATP-binding cassette permease mdl1, partial [Tulasnella sp. 403]